MKSHTCAGLLPLGPVTISRLTTWYYKLINNNVQSDDDRSQFRGFWQMTTHHRHARPARLVVIGLSRSVRYYPISPQNAYIDMYRYNTYYVRLYYNNTTLVTKTNNMKPRQYVNRNRNNNRRKSKVSKRNPPATIVHPSGDNDDDCNNKVYWNYSIRREEHVIDETQTTVNFLKTKTHNTSTRRGNRNS